MPPEAPVIQTGVAQSLTAAARRSWESPIAARRESGLAVGQVELPHPHERVVEPERLHLARRCSTNRSRHCRSVVRSACPISAGR